MKIHVGATWKLFFSYIAIIILLIIAVLLSGCGTKNSKINKYHEAVTLKEESKTEGSTSVKKEDEKARESEKSKESANDITSTKVVEKYYPDGSIKERSKQTFTDKSTSKSNKKDKSSEKSKQVDSSSFKQEVKKDESKEVDSVSKDIQKDTTVVANAGGKKTIIILGIIVIVVAGIVYLLRRGK